MHQTNNARFLDLLWRHVLSLGLLTVAFLVSYSRYSGRGRPPSPPCPCPLRSGWILGPHGGPEPWSLWAGPGRGPPASQVKRPGLQLPLATQSLLSTLSGAHGPGVSHLLPCPETDKLPSSRAGRAPAVPSLHLCSVGGWPLACLQKQLRVRVAPGLCPLWALGELGGGCGGTGHAGLSAASSVNLPLPVAQGLPAVPHLGPSAVRGHRWGPDGRRLVRLHPGGPHPAVP